MNSAPARVNSGSSGSLPRIAGYELRRRIGQGRMSTAYLAQDLRRDCDVVLKVLKPGHAGDSAREAAFAQEFTIPLQVRSEHVIRVFDQCMQGEYWYIAMEYLDGGDVAGRIRRGMTAAESLAVLRQAAIALAQVHGSGFVHCDVKPANLLLRSDGHLVLADFGLARRVGATSPSLQGTILGTPCYAAPEQAHDAGALPAADVYSLGVLFYEMLRGKPPFAGVSAMELQSQHLIAAVPRLPVELAQFQSLVDSMLQKQPDRRLADGTAVLHRIDSFAGRY